MPQRPTHDIQCALAGRWDKVRRCAPMDLIGRHMKGFFDYGIADEVHELKGDTAKGQPWGRSLHARSAPSYSPAL